MADETDPAQGSPTETATEVATEPTDTETPTAFEPPPPETATEDPESPPTEDTTAGGASDDTVEGAQGHDFDKGLGEMQKRQSTFETAVTGQFDAFQEKLDRMVEKLAPAAAPEKDPEASAPPAAITAEEVLAELGLEDDTDFANNATIKRTVAAMVTRVNKRLDAQPQPKVAPAADDSQLRQEVADLRTQIQQQASALTYWDKYEADHGFDGRSLWNKAQQEANAALPGDSPEARRGAANMVLARLTKEEKARRADEGDETPPAKPPARTSPAAAGTETVAPGSSGGRPTASPAKRLPAVWTPE